MKILFIFLIAINFAFADVNIKIEPKDNYSEYAIPNLRKRVWELEKAVAQMQKKMDLLEKSQLGGFECKMTSFGKTFTSINEVQSQAIDQVVKECSEANTIVHCKADMVKCENRNTKK